MINKARRADNIIEWIIIGIVAIIFLNLFLGKVYDHFQETVASSKLNKMFQPEQTRFEPSSNANYADPSSQINVPLVGEQGLTRYYNGSIRTINSLMNKDLTGNTVAQIHLAEAATVLKFMNFYINGHAADYSPTSLTDSYLYSNYGIIINHTNPFTTYIPITSLPPIEWVNPSIIYTTTTFSAPSTPEQEKIDAVAYIKMKFANLH